MLITSARPRVWWHSLLQWWYRFRLALLETPAPRAYVGAPRRYPIPPEKAHLYARAADEFLNLG